MKKVIFIVCLALLLKPVVPVFQYVFDYEYISQVLCVNKDKPELQCNGKCHLMKELAKASETEKPLSTDKKTSVHETTDLFVFNSVHCDLFLFVNKNTSSGNSKYINFYSYLNTNSFFHPPIFIS